MAAWHHVCVNAPVAVACPEVCGASHCSALFPDVVNCMQTDNLELKKLVYLYLMNYAKSQPDMAIMAVNTFVKVRERGCEAALRPPVTKKPSLNKSGLPCMG